FNVTIEAITDKEFNVNSTFIVYVDQTAPSIQKLEAPNEINSNDGLVNFNFTFSDENSGVFLAILDLGNGQSIEVTNQNSIEYRYKTSGVYQYELIITDFAGNQVSQTGVLALTFNSGLEDDSASSFGVFIFFMALIALITSWVWGPKLSENFSFDTIKNLFNKK
ncbi:MAG: PKD domain-containing protein, partial [Candidatus Kariarchaeum pelagius]